MSLALPWRLLSGAAGLVGVVTLWTAVCVAQAPGHGAGGMPAPEQSSLDISDLPAGTIEVQLVDPVGNPVAAQGVELTTLRSSIAEGDSHSERTQPTDALGKTTFSDLTTTTDFSYRVTVTAGPAHFGSVAFPIRRDMGHREVITIYPVTRDQREAQVVGRGVIAIHPGEDTFVVDVLYQLINIGKQAWVPDGLVLRLPAGWKAFTPQESPTDTHFEEEGDVGAKLLGTFAPGANEVGFRFSLTNLREAAFGMTVPLFPRTIEMRVIVDAGNDMTLKVPTYDEAIADRMRSGQRVLVAQHNYLDRREASPDSISIDIGGMRTKGNGHHIALALALTIVAYGLWSGWQEPRKQKGTSNLPVVDLNKARQLLLNELVALEHAREGKIIGSKAYGQTRQVLLTSLARLEATAVSS